MLVKGSYFFTYRDGLRLRVIAFDKVYADRMIYVVDNPSDMDFKNGCAARVLDYHNYYWFGVVPPYGTADSRINKIVNGTVTNLGFESVDLADATYTLALSISGSTLKAFRTDMDVPKLAVTDTSFASGYWGHSENAGAYWANPTFFQSLFTKQLLQPATELRSVLAIVEVPIEGSGRLDDPYRPAMSKNLVNILQLSGLPNYLYREAKKYEVLKNRGFTDDEIKTVFGNIQYQVDLDAVTWGAFEFHQDKSSTVIVTIVDDNPYSKGAVERQKSIAERWLRPPRDYREAVELYVKLRIDHPYWLAGKDSFAYQVLGHEIFDLFQNVDFYYGELVEHRTHYSQLKQVSDDEIRARLNELIDMISKAEGLSDERKKHVSKAREILRRGW
jgi:hypothetical protein